MDHAVSTDAHIDECAKVCDSLDCPFQLFTGRQILAESAWFPKRRGAYLLTIHAASPNILAARRGELMKIDGLSPKGTL
jgi:hypothetical protein